jgi:hypothetical protein
MNAGSSLESFAYSLEPATGLVRAPYLHCQWRLDLRTQLRQPEEPGSKRVFCIPPTSRSGLGRLHNTQSPKRTRSWAARRQVSRKTDIQNPKARSCSPPSRYPLRVTPRWVPTWAGEQRSAPKCLALEDRKCQRAADRKARAKRTRNAFCLLRRMSFPQFHCALFDIDKFPDVLRLESARRLCGYSLTTSSEQLCLDDVDRCVWRNFTASEFRPSSEANIGVTVRS